ncbi:RAMP superfamily CRISPR-associated protein [Vibrio breoganii]
MSNLRIYYTLTTLEPVIVSQNTATTTNHQGLDHIPGSAILGMLAGSLYQEVGEGVAWSLFHSAEVQYGPCYPLVEGEISLPTPASWHYQKMANPIRDDKYNSEQISNHASELFQRPDGVQFKQCRDGFVSSQGKLGKVEQGIVTKTALDRKTGGVKDGSLFSYAYIEENQSFAGWIECQSQSQVDLIRSHLFGEKRIGRSRSAEFGSVRISESALTKPQESIDDTTDKLVLWCLSDCQILAHNGLPTFTPCLSDLIPEVQGTLDRERSFVRSTTTSRYNQARQGFDSEQPLIAKGSVLVFKDCPGLSPDHLQQLRDKGIGINRQQGLGWVGVNPAWASNGQLTNSGLFDAYSLSFSQQKSSFKEADTAFTRWLSAKNKSVENQNEINTLANTIIKQVLSAYQQFRSYNNIQAPYAIGPSNTQWGRVREAIRTKPNNWKSRLFRDREQVKGEAICKSINDANGWGVTWSADNRFESFASFLEKELSDKKIEAVILATERLSRYDLSNFTELNKAQKELLSGEARNSEVSTND